MTLHMGFSRVSGFRVSGLRAEVCSVRSASFCRVLLNALYLQNGIVLGRHLPRSHDRVEPIVCDLKRHGRSRKPYKP